MLSGTRTKYFLCGKPRVCITRLRKSRIMGFEMLCGVCGYHYRDIWASAVGEVLPCEQELQNARDGMQWQQY